MWWNFLPYLSNVSLDVTFSKSLFIRIPPKVNFLDPHLFLKNQTLFLSFKSEGQGVINYFY